MPGRHRLAGFGQPERDREQCDTVTFDDYSAFRCRQTIGHGGPCRFMGARNGDGVCNARSINAITRRLRRCLLAEAHDPGHIFAWYSERDAEPEEIGMPEHPHIGLMIVRARAYTQRG